MDDGTAAHDAQLRRVLSAFPGQGFAVLDGARSENRPDLCRRERLFARSLFLNHADVEVEKAGPWLIGLGQAPDALDRVLALVGAEPAAVYWCCDGGEAVLHRHLRTLNMARIPAWATVRGTAAPSSGAGQKLQPVMFRHWNPRVLGALVPVLDGAQFARVLGPACEIAFLAVDYGGVRRVVTDVVLPPAPDGLLTIRSDQIESLSRRRVEASHRRVTAYLREVVPEVTDRTSDAALVDLVLRAHRTGRDLGARIGSQVGAFGGRWVGSWIASHMSNANNQAGSSTQGNPAQACTTCLKKLNPRHDPCKTRGNDPTKEKNTMIDPDHASDVANDVKNIQSGNVPKQSGTYTTNGRTYGVDDQALYSESGPGLTNVSRGMHQVLK